MHAVGKDNLTKATSSTNLSASSKVHRCATSCGRVRLLAARLAAGRKRISLPLVANEGAYRTHQTQMPLLMSS